MIFGKQRLLKKKIIRIPIVFFIFHSVVTYEYKDEHNYVIYKFKIRVIH